MEFNYYYNIYYLNKCDSKYLFVLNKHTEILTHKWNVSFTNNFLESGHMIEVY